MGFGARNNPNSLWSRKKATEVKDPSSVQVASPITTAQKVQMVTTPARPDEPMVIELTLKNVWGLLCRKLKKSPSPQSPALTN